MYCKETFGRKTSKLKQERFRCTTQYFHEDKENFCITIYARMQGHHNLSCSCCRKCHSAKESSVKWIDRSLRENYCTDCSGITRNKNRNKAPGNQCVDGDNLHCEMSACTQENYTPVYNTRRTYRSTRGSMYGCDQIYVEDIPPRKDVNNSGAYIKQHQAKTSVSTKAKDENYIASETRQSNYSEKWQNGSEKISHHNVPEKRSRMSRNNKIGSDKNHLNDPCSSKRERSSEAGGGNRTSATESESSVKRTYSNEASGKTFEGETKPAFTDGRKAKTNIKKSETADPDEAKKADKYETFQEKDKRPTKSVKAEDGTPKHDGTEHVGRDRPKVPKGLKRMPRKRVQRKPQTHVTQTRDAENQGGGGVDEWLLFVFDSIKKGVVSTLSEIPSYLSIGWSLLVYFLLVLILLVFPIPLCIWAFVKNCFLCIVGMFRLLGNKIFKKRQKNTAETSEQQSRRPATRQRSDPLPGADELVSKLLASKELDAYEVLGVLPSASDEEIKRRYRDMAKVVHPDKNPHEDASEAFQILQSAFEAIGDEEKRMSYQFDCEKKRFQEEFDEFFENFMERMEKMKNRLMCRVCQDSHPRLLTDRSIFAARYCSECGVRHPAKEGDVWVETSHLGFKYYCYLCVNRKVYEVTEWAACQGILRGKANLHTVFMSVKPNHSPWEDMFGNADRSNPHGNNKKKRKSKGKSNKNKKH